MHEIMSMSVVFRLSDSEGREEWLNKEIKGKKGVPAHLLVASSFAEGCTKLNSHFLLWWQH